MRIILHSLTWHDERGIRTSLYQTTAERDEWLREYLLGRCLDRAESKRFEAIENIEWLSSALFEANLMDCVTWKFETHTLDINEEQALAAQIPIEGF